ncbi:hypothetical protein BIV59_22295 [Bacillus sp. MUM 13]|nr:hypothetical protein BIV59_22295 [Bacillus sp. MUM 13]
MQPIYAESGMASLWTAFEYSYLRMYFEPNHGILQKSTEYTLCIEKTLPDDKAFSYYLVRPNMFCIIFSRMPGIFNELETRNLLRKLFERNTFNKR